jgi:hypothetical protein
MSLQLSLYGPHKETAVSYIPVEGNLINNFPFWEIFAKNLPYVFLKICVCVCVCGETGFLIQGFVLAKPNL